MRRRTFVSLAGTGTLTALAGCLASAGSDEENGSDTEESHDGRETLLKVAGSGAVETDPDHAVAQFSVVTVGEDAETVRDELATRAEDVRTALLDAGIPDDDIRTSRFDVRPDRREEREFRGEHRYEVEIADVDRVGEIIDVAIDAGADDVGRLTFTLSEETRAELREEALHNALDAAREEADTIAENKQLAIVGVEEIASSGTNLHTTRADAPEEAYDDAGTDLDPGPVTVTATVAVVYVAEAAA